MRGHDCYMKVEQLCRICLVWGVIQAVPVFSAEPQSAGSDWRQSLSFYASFDQSADADFARGDARIHHSPDLSRKVIQPGLPTVDWVTLADQGKFGSRLQFHRKTDAIVFFQGGQNVSYQPQNFGGTVSLWMQLNPDKDLAPGYVDPLQITDKDWNNSALFLDFTKDDTPRHFRLGVFSDLAFWNPQNRDWDTIPVNERPMIVSTQPPFSSAAWTHVAFTWQGFNQQPSGEKSAVHFYLDGRPVGSLSAEQRFSWEPEKLVIMLGIYYTGGMDEFAIFDRSFRAEEIQQLRQLSRSLRETLLK